MATVDDVARSALGALDTNAGFLRAVAWTVERLREVNNRVKLRSLRCIGEVVIPATIETGTAAVTRGSHNVTGNAAAQAVWTEDIIGRYLRFTSRNHWYRIAGVTRAGSTLEIRLDSEFADDDVSAGAYQIVQRFTPLDPRVRHLGKFVFMRLRRELQTVTLTDLDISQPDRIQRNAAGPIMVAEVGVGDDGRRLVEMYPYPKTSEIIRYVFWAEVPQLQPGDTLPAGVDAYALKEGVLVDLLRYEMSRALQDNRVDKSVVYRNDYRAQQTTWREIIKEVQRADKGLDDTTLILRTGTSSSGGFFRNDSARTEIFIRGARP